MSVWGEFIAPLAPLLTRRNGFYAYHRSLHVFPAGPALNPSEPYIEQWNLPGLWRAGYGEKVDGLLFFAEDLFGEQFAVGQDGIVRFCPETGEIQEHSRDIEEWAQRIVERRDYETGFHLAREWARRNGPLEPGRRLLPCTPFVLGGNFTIDNLFDGDALEGMRFRADLALQVREIPDGAAVRLVIPER